MDCGAVQLFTSMEQRRRRKNREKDRHHCGTSKTTATADPPNKLERQKKRPAIFIPID